MVFRLYNIDNSSVEGHEIEKVRWEQVWAVSHVWDNGPTLDLDVRGCRWQSKSFSSKKRYETLLQKACEVVADKGAKFLWMDCLCIDQHSDEDKIKQIPHMADIFSKSAGTVAFGKLSDTDEFSNIVHPYDDGSKAWVTSWFERVWIYQEMQLPREVLFVSHDRVFTRIEIYWMLLLMSPYLTPTGRLTVQDLVNAVSPKSKSNTQRALMQASMRECAVPIDKVYGILGALNEKLRSLKADYDLSQQPALLGLMKLMSHNDIMDTLTFNVLPHNGRRHDSEQWSGMMHFNEQLEHPSYETDEYYGLNARLVNQEGRAYTVVEDAVMWTVKIMESEQHADALRSREWPHIADVAHMLEISGNFDQIEEGAEFIQCIDRVGRSIKANLQFIPESFKALHIPDIPSRQGMRKLPANRLGIRELFGKEVTVLMCRSKAANADGLSPFHYGICVEENGDGTSWYKLCTACFAEDGSEITEKKVLKSIKIGVYCPGPVNLSCCHIF